MLFSDARRGSFASITERLVHTLFRYLYSVYTISAVLDLNFASKTKIIDIQIKIPHFKKSKYTHI